MSNTLRSGASLEKQINFLKKTQEPSIPDIIMDYNIQVGQDDATAQPIFEVSNEQSAFSSELLNRSPNVQLNFRQNLFNIKNKVGKAKVQKHNFNMNTSQEDLRKTYYMWKEKPNLLIEPNTFKMNITRDTFNSKYKNQGYKPIKDSYFNMAIKMPKTYAKSLESYVKTSREIKISESLNRFPSKTQDKGSKFKLERKNSSLMA